MRKAVALLLAVVMVLSFAGCSGNTDETIATLQNEIAELEQKIDELKGKLEEMQISEGEEVSEEAEPEIPAEELENESHSESEEPVPTPSKSESKDYSKEIASLKEDISELEKLMASLKEQLALLQKKAETASHTTVVSGGGYDKATVDQLIKELDNLKKEVAELKAENKPNKPDDNFTGPDEPFMSINKVALITDAGTVDDESYNQVCWQGVEAWCKEAGVDYTYYQPSEDSTDARILSITQAVTKGANVIIMPGYLFGSVLPKVQDKYPNVRFIAIDVAKGDLTEDYVTYYEPSENAVCAIFAEEEAGFIAGYAAVKEGYTKLGFLGGMAVPAVIRYGYGFVQGADAAAAELGVDVAINYTYGGQFFGDDSITAKMEGWYAAGTQIVFACGGSIYTSAVEAALKYNGKVIGIDVDQHPIGENAEYAYNPFLTSAIKNMEKTIETVLDGLNDGEWDTTFGGKILTYSVKDGDYVGLPTAEDSWCFKTFTVEDYEAVKASIKDGSVVVDNTSTEPDASKYSYEKTTVNYVA